VSDLSIPAGDIINGELERQFGSPIPEDRMTLAREDASHLTKVALAMAEDVPQFARWANGRTITKRLLIAELGQLHPVELEELVIVLAKAVARRDPDRFDGRFSEATQKLADAFRS
jgi:hypothetical protein